MIAHGYLNTKRIRRARSGRRGQTIVISLLVLLLLAFAGALFVTVVARNLINAGHQVRHMTAEYYAQQGIQFVDDQLTTSVDGADWRPPVSNPVSPNDPDAVYMNTKTGTWSGFFRYNAGGGRYLVRVTYNNTNPNVAPNDPLKKLIKIESIGREGVVDQTDPTTWQRRNQTATYRVAYKAIGITDYARFETNIDKRTEIVQVGVPSQYDGRKTNPATKIYTPGVVDVIPSSGSTITAANATLDTYPLITQYGAPDAYIVNGTALIPNPAAGTNPTGTTAGVTYAPGGGSLRANASLRLFGENVMYLNGAGGLSESTQIAGDLLLDRYDPKQLPDAQPSQLIIDPPTVPSPLYVKPSTDAGYDTISGLVRDGKQGNDVNGYPRFIKRLDPPVIDTANSATGLTRYTNLALNSNPRVNGYLYDPTTKAIKQTAVTSPTAAVDGYGKVIYINNSDEVQAESSNITGGYTLVDDWLNRISSGSNAQNPNGHWLGDTYEPPGVQIILGKIYALPNHPFGITLIKDAGTWKAPDGTATTDQIMYIPYADVDADGTNPTDRVTSGASNPLNPNNDVTIVAAGNVRIFGIVSEDSKDPSTTDTTTRAINQAARHLTIVSNATAYIDGSILKGNPASSVAIMARDYVCVNTTQFTAGPRSAFRPDVKPLDPAGNGVRIHRNTDFLSELLYSGLLPGKTQATTYASTSEPGLYFSAATEGTEQSVLDFSLFNPESNTFIDGSNGFSSATAATGASGTAFGTTGLFKGTLRSSLDIAGITVPTSGARFIDLFPSQRTDLWIDNNNADANAKEDVDLEHVAILPGDVRIEAMLYAQNRSFFVIPGKWFNSKTDDDIGTYITNNRANPGSKQKRTIEGPADEDPKDSQHAVARFPFYGQPIDLKITIYGAVSEARPADLSAQTEWMRKWGWIPSYHGARFPGGAVTEDPTPAETAGHVGGTSSAGYAVPAAGLTMIYDPLWGYPTSGTPLRWSGNASYAYPLPYAPKLPVCPGLLFSAQPQQFPLL